MTTAYPLLERVYAIDNGDAHVPELNRRNPTSPRSRTVTHDEAMAYWVAFRALLNPYELAAHQLRQGNAAGLDDAVAYLDARPRFFGSGYLAEELMHALSVGPDPGSYKPLLRRLVVRDTPLLPRRSLRYMAQLAARVWDESLDHDLTRLERGPAHRAAWTARMVRTRVPLVLVSRGGQGRLGHLGKMRQLDAQICSAARFPESNTCRPTDGDRSG
ncbi:hypothetical protein OCAE111667_17140 [Occultella aeris]|uniref:Uncharacterized protein n=1 Tax=Occultella aeris TaxID=2761496 RepID=A0A7M4DMH3_9MICO|nr:hypothetical protein [Occultella aeris]VZO38583.1 hypothetical protein HALOF300_03344 [Occultella aeris]